MSESSAKWSARWLGGLATAAATAFASLVAWVFIPLRIAVHPFEPYDTAAAWVSLTFAVASVAGWIFAFTGWRDGRRETDGTTRRPYLLALVLVGWLTFAAVGMNFRTFSESRRDVIRPEWPVPSSG
jgi:hypothetical protein